MTTLRFTVLAFLLALISACAPAAPTATISPQDTQAASVPTATSAPTSTATPLPISPSISPAQQAFMKGIVDSDNGDLDRAIADYTKAIELDPKLLSAYINRGLAYDGKGNFDQAIADYTKAIELDPTFALAYIDRGGDYRDVGTWAKIHQAYPARLGLPHFW